MTPIGEASQPPELEETESYQPLCGLLLYCRHKLALASQVSQQAAFGPKQLLKGIVFSSQQLALNCEVPESYSIIGF